MRWTPSGTVRVAFGSASGRGRGLIDGAEHTGAGTDFGNPYVQAEVGLASFNELAHAALEAPLVGLGATPALARLRSAPRPVVAPGRDHGLAVWRR